MFGFSGIPIIRRPFERQTSLRKGKRKRQAARARLQIETLEDRSVPSTLTGFSLVEQQGFPGPQTTVVSLPTGFQDQIAQKWQDIHQTFDQVIADGVQQAAQQQGVSAYNISDSLTSQGTYSATLDTSQPTPTVQIQYRVANNTLDFTTTTNDVLGIFGFGSYADPSFHVVFGMTLYVSLTLPSLSSQPPGVSATASITDVTVSSDNLGVWFDQLGADVLNGLGWDVGRSIAQQVADGLSGQSQGLSDPLPTGILQDQLNIEAANGYTHLHAGLDNDGNLLLTAQSPNLVINGSANDSIFLDASSDGTVTAIAGGQWASFDAGYLQMITINSADGGNWINILGVPAGVSVNVNGSAYSNDQVLIGNNGSLANVAGPVNVNYSNGSGQATMTFDNSYDPENRDVNITSSSVQFSGVGTISYSGNVTSLSIWGGSGWNFYKVLSTSAPLLLVPGSGENSITIGDNYSLASIGGTIDVEGSIYGGQDWMVIEDGNDFGRDLTLTDSTVSYAGVPTITYSGLGSLELMEANGSNTITVNSAPQGTAVSIYDSRSNIVTGPATWEVTFYWLPPIWLLDEAVILVRA
jgi:hypothetical protein